MMPHMASDSILTAETQRRGENLQPAPRVSFVFSSLRRFIGRLRPERISVSLRLCGKSSCIRLPKVIAILIALAMAAAASAQDLDRMALDRWKQLGEADRYQMQVAEEYYRKGEWKVAAAEYEKFLTLYERSEGAPYSQLKWSLCQVKLRKLNTAIKDGFQSVIDYWPDGPDAVASAYYIGRTYKDMGEMKSAKKAYRTVLSKHPKHLVAVYAATDLIDIAQLEKDQNTQVALWKTLTFDTERTKEARTHCVKASQELATHSFRQGAFDDGLKALATTYNDAELPSHVVQFARGPISTLTADAKTAAAGGKTADLAIAWLKSHAPADTADPESKKNAQQHWFLMADLHAAARRDDQIPAFYEQIGRQFGVDDATLERLAAWYKSKGRHDEARATYARYSDKVAGQSHVAYSYREQGKHAEAVTASQQCLALDPQNPVKWKTEIAHNYRWGHKWNEAVATYTDLMTEDKEQPQQWRWQIGHTHREAGQYKEAIGVFRQCENFPENYRWMAWCHRQLKQWNEAILLYNQIVGSSPESAPWALLQVGYTQEQAGRNELAIKALQQVCKRWPKDGHASEAHAYLQSKFKITVTLGGTTDE